MDYLKEFISKLHNLDKARRVNEAFKDFLILYTCSLVQPFYSDVLYDGISSAIAIGRWSKSDSWG